MSTQDAKQMSPGDSAQLGFVINRPNVLNANAPKHFHVKANVVRNLRATANKLAEERYPGGLRFDKCRVIVTVFPPTRRRLDPPNLYPTAKALIDGLTDAGWWDDDNYEHLLEMSFRYGGLSGNSQSFLFLFEIIEEEAEHGFVLTSEVNGEAHERFAQASGREAVETDAQTKPKPVKKKAATQRVKTKEV